MTVLDAIRERAGGVVGDVQRSMRRARLDGERRILQRQHRAALESLGARAFDLISTGRLPAGDLAPEVANVEGKLMEIDAKDAEIAVLRDAAEPSEQAAAGSGWAAAERFFRRR